MDKSEPFQPPYAELPRDASTNKTTKTTLFRGMSMVEKPTQQEKSVNPNEMNPSRLVNYLYATSTNQRLTGQELYIHMHPAI